ncbi:hypothetical protein pb186bvf_007324 [Paramecium bursaria]
MKQQLDEEGFESTCQDKVTLQNQLPEPNPIITGRSSGLDSKTLFKQKQKHQLLYERHLQQKIVYQQRKGPKNLKYGLTSNILIEQQQLHHNESIFDSQFPSGNLLYVYELGNHEYDLLISDDTNTNGYNQWFYFYVRAPCKIKVNIINLTKKYEQLNKFGIYVKRDRIWEIKYVQQSISSFSKLKYDQKYQQLFKLSFELEQGDQYVALTIPYTLQHLEITYNPKNFTTTYKDNQVKYLEYGRHFVDVIIIMARQHPGETVSSHVCDGMIKAIQESYILQDRFHIVIFPMMNPDGVQYGNFRCDSSGKDLNRVWSKPHPVHHKHILEIKRYISSLLRQGKDIKLFLDIHGHSKKQNAFFFGCRGTNGPIECRIFPKICEKISKYFSFQDCTFYIEAYKQKTARATIFKMLQHYRPNTTHNVLTLEVSFFGFRDQQFALDDLHQIGHDTVRAMELYFSDTRVIYETTQELQKNNCQYDYEDKMFMDQDLSDSDPEQDMLSDEQYKKLFKIGNSQEKQIKEIKNQKNISFVENYQPQYKLDYKIDRTQIIRRTTSKRRDISDSSQESKINLSNIFRTSNEKRVLYQQYKTEKTKYTEENNQSKQLEKRYPRIAQAYIPLALIPPAMPYVRIRHSSQQQSSFIQNTPSIPKPIDHKIMFEFQLRFKRKNTQV